jgi:predicted dehydrogenase
MHAYSYANTLNELPETELVGIYGDAGPRGSATARQFGVDLFDNWEELTAADIDALVVCTHNSSHRSIVEAAAVEGIDVLCEPPLATSVEDATAMVEVCRREGVLLTPALYPRFHPAAVRARELLADGHIGKLEAVRGVNRSQRPTGTSDLAADAGGGAIVELGPELIDLACWLLEDEVEKVFAETGSLLPGLAVEYTALLTLDFASAAFAVLDTSWSRPGSYPKWGDLWLELVGTEGTLRLDLAAQNLLVVSDDELGHARLSWGDDMNRRMIRDFCRTIGKGQAPRVETAAGLRTQVVVAAAYRSTTSGEVEPVQQ